MKPQIVPDPVSSEIESSQSEAPVETGGPSSLVSQPMELSSEEIESELYDDSAPLSDKQPEASAVAETKATDTTPLKALTRPVLKSVKDAARWAAKRGKTTPLYNPETKTFRWSLAQANAGIKYLRIVAKARGDLGVAAYGPLHVGKVRQQDGTLQDVYQIGFRAASVKRNPISDDAAFRRSMQSKDGAAK